MKIPSLVVTIGIILAPLTAQAQVDTPQRWTREDIAAYCNSRWPGYVGNKACLLRNARKLGREKTPGEIQELQSVTPVQPAASKPKS